MTVGRHLPFPAGNAGSSGATSPREHMTPQLNRVDDFQAAMTHRTIDCLAFNEVRGPSHDTWRTSAAVSRGGSPVFFVNLYLSGNARVEQNGLEVAAAPGHLLLFDSCRPFKLKQPEQTDLLSLAVPHSVLNGRDTPSFDGRPLRLPETAPAHLLVSQMQPLSQWRSDIRAADAAHIAQALVGLLRATLSAAMDSGPGQIQQRRLRRGTQRVAARFGVTPPSSLHSQTSRLRSQARPVAGPTGVCLESRPSQHNMASSDPGDNMGHNTRRDSMKFAAGTAVGVGLAACDGNQAEDVLAPAFVLVHGAWHGASTYERVIPLLAAKGHCAVARDLPAHGLNTRFPTSYDVRPLDPAAFGHHARRLRQQRHRHH